MSVVKSVLESEINLEKYVEIPTSGHRSRIFIGPSGDKTLLKYTNVFVKEREIPHYNERLLKMMQLQFIPHVFTFEIHRDDEFFIPDESKNQYNCLIEMEKLDGDLSAFFLDFLARKAVSLSGLESKQKTIFKIFRNKCWYMIREPVENGLVTYDEYRIFSNHLKQLFRSIIYELNTVIWRLCYEAYVNNCFLSDFNLNNFGYKVSEEPSAFTIPFDGKYIQIMFIDFDDVSSVDESDLELVVSNFIRKRKPFTKDKIPAQRRAQCETIYERFEQMYADIHVQLIRGWSFDNYGDYSKMNGIPKFEDGSITDTELEKIYATHFKTFFLDDDFDPDEPVEYAEERRHQTIGNLPRNMLDFMDKQEGKTNGGRKRRKTKRRRKLSVSVKKI
jgi:hypothetical protein